MKKETYNLASEKFTLINWLHSQIDSFNDVRDKNRIRVHFELTGYDGKNQILSPELKEEICKIADKVKTFYISEKEKLEKEVNAL